MQQSKGFFASLFGVRRAPVLVERVSTRAWAMMLSCLVAVALAACGASVGTKAMPRVEVEKQSKIELSKVVGVPVSQVPPVNCPGDLEAKVGAKMICAFGQAPGKIYDMTVTVTKVNDKTKRVYFDVNVANQPRAMLPGMSTTGAPS